MPPEPSQAVERLTAAESHFARGETLALLERWQDAADAYAAAISLNPAYPEALSRRAIALIELKEFEEAYDSITEALRLRPDYAEAWSNLGIALSRLNRGDEAIAAADRALALDPSWWAAYTTRGNSLRALGRIPEAQATYDRAIELAPHNAAARLNRALCLLVSGDFDRGWAEYEWRWRTAHHQQHARLYDQPLWLGQQPVAGRTLLIHAEQGLGDTLQFCRYAEPLAALGATVLLAAPQVLHGLLTSLAGVSLLVGSAEAAPPFDLQCPLLSLPLAFRTRHDTIPARVPYLQVPAPYRAKWRTRLGPPRGVRIGLAWSGNPKHGNDRNRSIPLDLASRMIPNGAEVYCLGREMRPPDIPALAAIPHLQFFGPELAEFADTAALAAAMDLVITVDTAVLHLAGALGLPTWGLLPFACDWRWMLGREDTPWYPTMRLFRQPAPGDWSPIVEAVRTAADAFVAFRQVSLSGA